MKSDGGSSQKGLSMRALFGLISITCGAEGDRTPDLVSAIHALSQLSYSPLKGPDYSQGWVVRKPAS